MFQMYYIELMVLNMAKYNRNLVIKMYQVIIHGMLEYSLMIAKIEKTKTKTKKIL